MSGDRKSLNMTQKIRRLEAEETCLHLGLGQRPEEKHRCLAAEGQRRERDDRQAEKSFVRCGDVRIVGIEGDCGKGDGEK